MLPWGNITSDGVEYRFKGCYISDKIFDNKEDADEYGSVMGAEKRSEDIKRFQHRKENNKHTWAWHVCYHRRLAKKAREDLDYHNKKLGISVVKSKKAKA